MRSLRPVFLLCFAALAFGAATAPASGATASVDVVTLPGSGAGPVTSRTWGAQLRDAWIKRVTFDVPARYFNEAALDALLTGTEVGELEVSGSDGHSGWVESGRKVVVGDCPAENRDCQPVSLRRTASGRVLLSLRLADKSSRGGGIVWANLRLRNVETTSGPLFRTNPAKASRADTWLTIVPCSTYNAARRCGEDGKRVHASVRELLGARTSVTLRRSLNRGIIGRRVVFSGRVIRAGKPAAGERVIVAPYHQADGSPGSPGPHATSVAALTDKQGRFRVARQLGVTSRWAAWVSKPRTARGPKLNSLEEVPPEILYVRAPRPGLEKRNAQARSDGQTMARIVVRSPLPGYHLTTVVTVGDTTYRKTMRGKEVAFEVTGATGAPVQARVFQNHPNPEGGSIPVLIAPSFSRVLAL